MVPIFSLTPSRRKPTPSLPRSNFHASLRGNGKYSAFCSEAIPTSLLREL